MDKLEVILYERYRMCTWFPAYRHLTLNLSCIEQQLNKEKVFKILTEMTPKKAQLISYPQEIKSSNLKGIH